jgi:HNH endonuclease
MFDWEFFKMSGVKMALVGEAWGEHVILLDSEDYDRVAQYTWCVIRRGRLFHAMRKVNHFNTVFMHRYILGLKFRDGKIVDHINGNGLDNRKENLRIVSPRDNALNSDRSRNARLVEKHGNRFRLRPYINGTRINLGSFPTEEEALEALQRYRSAI